MSMEISFYNAGHTQQLLYTYLLISLYLFSNLYTYNLYHQKNILSKFSEASLLS